MESKENKYKLYELENINDIMMVRFICETKARNIVEAEFNFHCSMQIGCEYQITRIIE